MSDTAEEICISNTSPYPFKQEYMVARLFAAADDDPLTVLRMAQVRDCLISTDRERLTDAYPTLLDCCA